MQIVVKDRQSLLDIAVQYLGSALAVFALAERNGISITDRLRDGQVLTWELADTADAKVQKLYKLRGICPATDISQNETEMLLGVTDEYFWGCHIPPFVRPDDGTWGDGGEALPPHKRDPWEWEEWDGYKSYSVPKFGTEFDNGTNSVRPKRDPLMVNRINSVQRDLEEGKEVVSESGKTLARIFTDQFNDVFA